MYWVVLHNKEDCKSSATLYQAELHCRKTTAWLGRCHGVPVCTYRLSNIRVMSLCSSASKLLKVLPWQCHIHITPSNFVPLSRKPFLKIKTLMISHDQCESGEHLPIISPAWTKYRRILQTNVVTYANALSEVTSSQVLAPRVFIITQQQLCFVIGFYFFLSFCNLLFIIYFWVMERR